MYEPHFLNERLHVGWRRDAAVPVFYAGKQSAARPAAPRQARILSDINAVHSANKGTPSLVLESVSPDSVIERVKPGEVAWLPFFNHTYVQGDTAKEKQEVRDARLHMYWAYFFENSPLRLDALERQLMQPSSGPYGTFLLEKAKEWKRSDNNPRRIDHRFETGLQTPVSSASRHPFDLPESASLPPVAHTAISAQSTIPPIFRRARAVGDIHPTVAPQTALRRRGIRAVVDLTIASDDGHGAGDVASDYEGDYVRVQGSNNRRTGSAFARSDIGAPFRLHGGDHLPKKRHSSEDSTSIPAKRPKTTTVRSAVEKDPTTSMSASRLTGAASQVTSAAARDSTAWHPTMKTGRRHTVVVPGLSDLDSSSESEAEDGSSHDDDQW